MGGKSEACECSTGRERGSKWARDDGKSAAKGQQRAAKCHHLAAAYPYSINRDAYFASLDGNVQGVDLLQVVDADKRSDCHRAERITTLRGCGDYMDAFFVGLIDELLLRSGSRAEAVFSRADASG